MKMQKEYKIEELSIEVLKNHLKNHTYIQLSKGTGIFESGLLLDIQSINLLCKIYNALSPEVQTKFNGVLQDKWKVANLFDKMWSFAI